MTRRVRPFQKRTRRGGAPTALAIMEGTAEVAVTTLAILEKVGLAEALRSVIEGTLTVGSVAYAAGEAVMALPAFAPIAGLAAANPVIATSATALATGLFLQNQGLLKHLDIDLQFLYDDFQMLTNAGRSVGRYLVEKGSEFVGDRSGTSVHDMIRVQQSRYRDHPLSELTDMFQEARNDAYNSAIEQQIKDRIAATKVVPRTETPSFERTSVGSSVVNIQDVDMEQLIHIAFDKDNEQQTDAIKRLCDLVIKERQQRYAPLIKGVKSYIDEKQRVSAEVGAAAGLLQLIYSQFSRKTEEAPADAVQPAAGEQPLRLRASVQPSTADLSYENLTTQQRDKLFILLSLFYRDNGLVACNDFLDHTIPDQEKRNGLEQLNLLITDKPFSQRSHLFVIFCKEHGFFDENNLPHRYLIYLFQKPLRYENQVTPQQLRDYNTIKNANACIELVKFALNNNIILINRPEPETEVYVDALDEQPDDFFDALFVEDPKPPRIIRPTFVKGQKQGLSKTTNMSYVVSLILNYNRSS